MTNLQGHRGATWSFDIGPLKRRRRKLTSAELTNATLIFTVREESDPTSTLHVQHTCTIDLDTAVGNAMVPPASTDIVPGVYWYEFQLTQASGAIWVPRYGPFRVAVKAS